MHISVYIDVKKLRNSMPLPTHLLPTTVVGSYPQPDWLVDRAMLSKSVPRTRLHEMWRLPAEHLEQAQDDATVVAIRDMERAGIDIVTDGEIRRESYSNRFATALDGIDTENPAIITSGARSYETRLSSTAFSMSAFTLIATELRTLLHVSIGPTTVIRKSGFLTGSSPPIVPSRSKSKINVPPAARFGRWLDQYITSPPLGDRVAPT
jgi:Cobalamin-independent synthase, Catalytic domain